MSIDKKEMQEKILKYTEHKFPSSLMGYDPGSVDLFFDSFLIDYQYLISYSLELEKLNNQLKEENLALKNKIKDLENINDYLKNRVTLKRNNE